MPGNLDAYRHCEQLSHSNVISDQMIGWTGRWSIMGGFVLCTQCLAMQQTAEAQEPFPHLPDCIAEREGQYPWHELAALLRRLTESEAGFH